jgi:NHL repeat
MPSLRPGLLDSSAFLSPIAKVFNTRTIRLSLVHRSTTPKIRFDARPVLGLALMLTLLLLALPVNAGAQTAQVSYTQITLGSGFSAPRGVAVDGSGNVFVADTGNSAVKEILAAGGYTTVKTLGSGFSGPVGGPVGVAVDGSGNVFVAVMLRPVYEILAAGGYTTVKSLVVVGGLGIWDNFATGIAVDGSGNVFVANMGDPGRSDGAVYEILAADGYTTVKTLASGFLVLSGIAVDGSGNVFFSYFNQVNEILAAGGYTTVTTLGSDITGVAVDRSGNVFVGDYRNSVVEFVASTTSGCSVPDLPAITDPDALLFEGSPSNPPRWSLYYPKVDMRLDDTVTGLLPSHSSLERTSGYRPLAYQQHFRDIRDRAAAVDDAVHNDPSQESACSNLISTLKYEISLHGLKTSPAAPVNIPLVNKATNSSHTLIPAVAMDLNTKASLKGLIQPCIGGATPDLVHYTLPGTPCTQSVQAASYSPVAILVTDPLGRRVGFDSQQGKVINEIGASASYTGLTEPQLITIDDAIPGPYLLSGVGTDSGPYHLSLVRLDEDDEVLSAEERTGTTTVGATYQIATSVAKDISIDIKPGDRTTVINQGASGTIPVALLSAPDFNPILAVNKATLKFGPSGSEAAVIRCAANADLNGDGRQDLVCQFAAPTANFKIGQVQGVLTGTMLNGVPIMGIESIEVR